MIKFSIITVCLNAGDDLIDTVTSTLNQTYENFEIIVKDGLSTDGSVEQLPADPRIRLIRQKDTGIYDAMNHGVDEATGDYLIFMNAGDRFYSNKVLKDISVEMEKQTADIYYGSCYNQALKIVDPTPKELTKYFCYRSMICHQATVYKAKMLKSRGYDTAFTVSADRERMLYAVIKEKAKCIYVPVIVVSFQSGGFCTTDKAKRMLEDEKIKLRKRYFPALERFKYGLRYQISLPWLRRLILKDRRLLAKYKQFVARVYGNAK